MKPMWTLTEEQIAKHMPKINEWAPEIRARFCAAINQLSGSPMRSPNISEWAGIIVIDDRLAPEGDIGQIGPRAELIAFMKEHEVEPDLTAAMEQDDGPGWLNVYALVPPTIKMVFAIPMQALRAPGWVATKGPPS